MEQDKINLELSSPAAFERPATHKGVRLWIRLVGDFDAQIENGRSVLPVSKKARALLALVAAYMPQPVRRDFAASLLWSTKPREHAANSLRQALRELQIALLAGGEPPILLTGGGRLTLQTDSVWVDIHVPDTGRWKPTAEGNIGPLLLCQNLRGLDLAFDQHLERIWKNLVFQQAFVLAPESDSAVRPNLVENPATPPRPARTNNPPAPLPAGTEPLRVAPPVEDPIHGLGWRIAVLPFRSLGAPLEGGLSLGMAEEISAALGRFRMPRIIATGSFWDGSGPSADALVKSRAYNLDYVISGTIQTVGKRIRVTVTLLDVGMDFEVIWSSRFEGTTDDLFTLQDTIASQTVARIDPELLQRHQFRGDTVQTANTVAHRSVLTAIQGIYRPDKARFLRAREYLQHAIELDGEYAAAHAWLAYWYIIGIGQGWIDDDEQEAIRLAGVAAERAVALDPLDGRGLAIAGHVKAYLMHDLDTALVLHQRAITLNPNLPIAWTLSSWSHIYNGDHRAAVNHATMARSMSPTDPHVFLVEHAAMTAHFFLRDLDTAETLASGVLERKPGHASALKVRIAILGHLGRLTEAKALLGQLRSISSTVSIDRIIARPPLREHDREFYSAGLRMADASS